jgi:peroxidase
MATIQLLARFRATGAADNNLQNPGLDPTPGSAEIRLAPVHFAPGTTDGLIDGPNPRTISNVVSGGPQANVDDPTNSAWLYAFGQFVDHDLDLEAVGATAINIAVPAGDPNFADGSSIDLTRAITSPATGTAINTVAGYLDLSQIYGSDAATATSLRNADGTLQTSNGDELPIVDGAYVSGDTRVMENPELTAISTMFVREHNYWVGQLRQQHPNWTGDQLYNMAKAITTAEYQNVVYSEYLPALVGNAVGPYQGYNAKVNPQVTQEFSTAAFRVGHSEVSGNQTGLDNNGNVTFTETLAQSFFNTPAQDQANGTDSLLRNLSSDFSQATDVYAVDGLRNLLATNPDKMDLIAIDIQRERDLGLGTLNQTRQALGLAPYTSFAQLTSDPTVQANLQSVYGNINNVDLFIGGLAEDHAAGADVGPTFQKIIADQFSALRAGDRFFWQNEGFDPATARMIASTTLGDIIQRDTGTTVEQQNVFIAAQRHLSNVAADNPAAPQLVIGVDDAGAQISGGPADDTIVAGLGLHQILTGGGGNDVFVFVGGGHNDTISDFNGSDLIQFQPSATGDSTLRAAFSEANARVTVSDFRGGAVVRFDGNTITLKGVAAASLNLGNFLFPPGDSVRLDQTHHAGNGDSTST